MIDLSNLFKIDKISKERENRVPPTHELVRLNGGPLDNQFRRIEKTERILTFTTDEGAYQYIRRKGNRAYCEYDFLTPQLLEEIEFEEGLLKVTAGLDDPFRTMRWIARFGYSPKLIEAIRELGFRWDARNREWFCVGSRNSLSDNLNQAEQLSGVKVICEQCEYSE